MFSVDMWIPQARTSLLSSSSRQIYSASLPQTTDLLDRYRAQVTLGRITYDEGQVRVVMQLRRLQKELLDYAPTSISSLLHSRTHELSPTWWDYSQEESAVDSKGLVRFRGIWDLLADLDSPKGLLLTGPPGSGKSFLVDLWYSGLPTPYKTRKHYNQLVLDIYRAVWLETQRRMAHSESFGQAESEFPTWTKTLRNEWRKLYMTGSFPIIWNRFRSAPDKYSSSYPPMAYTIARRLVLRHWLLVFDEIQLLDVSSAVLLSDVLSWFWRLGGVVVGTSNKVPDDLYKNGVQRERLEPFVEAMKIRCPVTAIEAENDWRIVRGGDVSESMWFLFGQEDELGHVLHSLSSEPPHQNNLDVFGHLLCVPWASGLTAKFTFHELCAESLGSADYLTIASHFRTVVITDIPILKLASKNEARRFISLIDSLYESRCIVICHAEAHPLELFFPDAAYQHDTERTESDDVMMAESVAELGDIYRPNISSYDAPRMDEVLAAKTVALDQLSFFSGKDEQFAFKRAVSRLIEMTGHPYRQSEAWTPLPLDERKWERSTGVTQNPSVKPCTLNERGVFTSESVHKGAGNALKRPAPPQLKHEHVWGVRDDWGPGAKRWGRGSKVYEKE